MARCTQATAQAFTPRGFVIPLPCGKWNCPGCAHTLATEWAIRARLGVGEGKAHFWTLTMPGKVRTTQYAYEILPDCWDKFRRVMQVLRDDWSYIAFVEGQPNRFDMPHFHMLSLEKCPFRLKDLAVACGFGQQADDELVRDKQAARYVSKYLTKQSPTTPKGFHRVRCSQDWPKLPPLNRQPLIVKSKGELWFDYFMRVSDTCSLSISEVIDRWNDATGMTFDEF